MLSVVIPTLNEAANVRVLLEQLNAQTGIPIEIIVVDGGSTDDTRAIVGMTPALLLTSSPGRGCQMNLGAASAQGDWLLFLHADSQLTAPDQLADAVAFMETCQGTTAGHFSMKFCTNNLEVKQALAFFEAKTSLNRPGTFNGDQGLLIAAAAFRRTGAFWEVLPFLEDQDFGRRFLEFGSFITLPGELNTSARRFEDEGVQERIILNAIIMGMFTIGHHDFFESAPGVYRNASQGLHLDLLPFITLVKRCIFDRGVFTGIGRCYKIGRYISGNTWQLFLLRGLKTSDVKASLDFYDRFIALLANNPIGGALGTVSVVCWFFFIELRYRYASSRPMKNQA